MNERRQGQHKAVHRLAQVYADLVLAEKEIAGLDGCDAERKHRVRCFINEAIMQIGYVVDKDLGLQLITKENENE